jgi:hypothetical protein
MITSTSMKSIPPPDSLATQDMLLPNAPTTAPMEMEGWKTVEGKAIQRKKRNEEVDKKWVKETYNKTPMIKNSR